MKALVLCGGIPQIALINELKNRGIYTILADMNPNVSARPFADEFYPVSVLDMDAVKQLALEKNVDIVLTACADQVLLVQAKVSEELDLPSYIDYKTAKDVSSKELMKNVFNANNIPTSKHIIMEQFDTDLIKDLRFPLIVKPVDSYSSRGVRKVLNTHELKVAFEEAEKISSAKTVIVEEFIEGEELTVDAFVENGKAHVLCISNIDKVPGYDRFVICRTRYPADISDEIEREVEIIAEKIAKAFNLINSPMLIQMITDGTRVSVVEFCARTGGGDKFRLIKQTSGFDVIKAVVDLTLGIKPRVHKKVLEEGIVNEFVYTSPGVFSHIEGFEELKKQGLIKEYYQLKSTGTYCGEIKSSGDRIAYYTVQGKTISELRNIDQFINKEVKVIDSNGTDIMRHDLVANY